MTYQIGQIVPDARPRPAVLGEVLTRPVWHILRVVSGAEAVASDKLRDLGVHCCYPVEDRERVDCGKTIRWQVPTVPGYVFAKFSQAPNWSELRRRRMIVGMVCRETPWGPVPYRATEDDVRTFMGLPTVAEEVEAARRAALQVRPGDQARVLVGEDLAMAVTVLSVRDGRVFWEAGTVRGETREDRCERIVPGHGESGGS